jgi:hypothetical protein
LFRSKAISGTLGCLLFLILFVKPAHAQHGDWLLGTDGLLSAQQAPEGILYQNLWSYYHASGSSFLQSGPIICGPRGKLCLGFNANANGSLDLFVDQNIFWLVTPYKLLGANYGFLIDVPFGIADASGAAALEPFLSSSRIGSVTLASLQRSPGATKGTIGDIYFEPIDLGWHLRQLDAIVAGGFFAPTGAYNSNAKLNIGYGHWSGVLGLGGIVYADAARTWGLSIYSHYVLYASQIGRNYTLGDQVPFEWSASKTFKLGNGAFEEATLGAVGYAEWQISDNQINVNPPTQIGRSILSSLESTHSQIYAAGPGIQVLTKFGLFDLRYYDEFGNRATPSGQQLMFSVTLAGNPLWKN